MLAVIGAVGQAERETMLERQRDGSPRRNAREIPRWYTDCARRAPDHPAEGGGVTPTEIASRFGSVRASVYRVLACRCWR